MERRIKSAVRAIAVLELFDRLRRAATQAEVASLLAMPQSSASMLLRNLAALGYLTYEEAGRTYVPTPKVALLGSWIAPSQQPRPAVMAVMHELSRLTGGTIILGMLAGGMVRYVHVVPATTAMRLHVDTDTSRPLATSGIGRVFLSTMAYDQVSAIVARHNASAASDEVRLSFAAVLRDLARIRARGYAVSLDRVVRGAGVVAVPVASPAYQTPLALGIGGLTATIAAEAVNWAGLMVQALARCEVSGGLAAGSRPSPSPDQLEAARADAAP